MTMPFQNAEVTGTVYGIALNDKAQRDRLAATFAEPPYKAPPKAPVLYIKPRNCLRYCGAPTPVPAELSALKVAATVALLFERDLTRAVPEEVRSALAGACLALDISEPIDSFYRPAIRQMCRDGFLPLGRFASVPERFGDIVTEVDGREVHRWSLDALVRPIEAAAAEISGFMTLRAGDLLLVGVPGDAPLASVGGTITVQSAGLNALSASLVPEQGQ